MSDIFYYTFRTNKDVEEIEGNLGQKIFIVSKPAQDFSALVSTIAQSGASKIVGIAMIKGDKSRFEIKTFNKIGTNKAVKGSSYDFYKLNVPDSFYESGFVAEDGMSPSFCNYVCFKLADSMSDCKHYFIHLNQKDIKKLTQIVL